MADLARSVDEAVVVLLAMLFVLIQFLPAQAHCHWTKRLIYPKVVPVLWNRAENQLDFQQYFFTTHI